MSLKAYEDPGRFVHDVAILSVVFVFFVCVLSWCSWKYEVGKCLQNSLFFFLMIKVVTAYKTRYFFPHGKSSNCLQKIFFLVIEYQNHGTVHSLDHGIVHSLDHGILHSLDHGFVPSLDHGMVHSLDHGMVHSLDHGMDEVKYQDERRNYPSNVFFFFFKM